MTQSHSRKKGNFFVLEGIDGSGKSTQLSYLLTNLKKAGVFCHKTCEPTGGPAGAIIRQVLTGRIQMDDRALAALFAADRLDHITNQADGVLKQIESGITLVSDRYYFSSYAYHSVDMPMDWVISANALAAQMLKPTCTFFIDIDPDLAMERIQKGRSHAELYETRERLSLVRKLYFQAFEALRETETIAIIDGSREPDIVAADIFNTAKSYL